MHGDGREESEHEGGSVLRHSVLDEPEDSEDSFLREVAQVAPPPRLPVPGEHMGGQDGRRFEILDELGGGGTARVFRAWDMELQRLVALKVLSVGEARTRESPLSLLRREAQAIARLDHENIVRIFDVAEWSSAPWEPRVPFLVMECLEGESLSALLKRDRPGLRRALQIMYGIAAGLAHAHVRHLTHRDLKPGNVLLTRDGGVKLLDFGLAHLVAASTSRVPHLATAGTPYYMAPEQWRGEAQDERADIWAAGIVLYELLTGERPYRADSLEELRAQVISPEPVPPIRTHHPELPSQLEQLVARMLAKDPAQRLRSAAELPEQLRQFQESLGPWHEAPLSALPQRRQVTLVSCRLSGLPELLDPEDSSELQATFHRDCSELIRRHGGSIALSVGEEVLACFGYPSAHEDDAARAVHAALHLAQELTVQVGLHTDSVVFDTLPMEQQGRMPTLQGAAPSMASWVAQQAGPGSVLLSGTTELLVRGSFETEPLGCFPCPGPPGERSAALHRVLGQRKAASRFERVLATSTLTPLVGRRRELERLLGLWEQARRGEGACVLLRGEAGVGKSRLIQELRERVSPDANHILRFQCWSQHYPNASHPAIEVLQRFFQFEPEGAPRQQWQGMEDLLEKAGLTPEHLREREGSLAQLIAGGPSAMIALLEQRKEYKRRLLELSRDLLLRMAQERPVLLSMEDLHWADPSTLELVGFLLGSIERARVLVLLSARPEFHPPWTGRPRFYPLVLDRLSPESTAALVRTLAGGQSLPEETVQQLVARTDGIPLFVEELTRMVLGQGLLAPASAIPVTLHALLLARLDALPPRQKALAQLCAAVGRTFTVALLSQLSAQDEAALRGALSGLCAAGLLQPHDDSGGAGYQFRHALIQETAYQSLPRNLRRQHHRRIAQALVEHFPEVVEARPELLAHHFTESGESEPAIQYWQRAAQHAMLRSASLEAVAHLQQALRLLRSLPETPKRAGEELRLLNVLGGLLMYGQGYGSPEVERLYSHALRLFQQIDEPQRDDPSWAGLGIYFLSRGRYREVQQLGARLVELGRRWEEPTVLRHGCWLMAQSLLLQGQGTRALEYFTQARELEQLVEPSAQPVQRALTGDLWSDAQVRALVFTGIAYSVRGQPEQAWRCIRETLERIHKLASPTTTSWGLLFLAAAAQILGEPRRTLEWTEQASALGAAIWLRVLRCFAEALHGWALFKLGQAREGVEALRGNVECLQELGALSFLPFFLSMLGEVYLELRQVEEGLAAVTEGLRVTQETGHGLLLPELHRLRGELLRVAGDEEEATRHLLRARLVAHRQEAALFELRATVSLGRQLRDLGHPEAARRRLERILARFPPELDMVDLREARALLGQVRSGP